MKKLHIRRKKTIEERIGDEVSKEVKEAKREWKRLVKFKDENYLLFTAFVILLSAAIIVNTVYVINSNKRINNRSTIHSTITISDVTKYLTSQQAGSNSVQTVKISNVTENDSVDHAFMIDDSETMLIMDISITNESAIEQQLIPVNQLFVRTNEGNTINLHASTYVKNPLGATDLKPGQTAVGQISFNVPKNISHPLLYVDTGWDRTVPLVFDVLH